MDFTTGTTNIKRRHNTKLDGSQRVGDWKYRVSLLHCVQPAVAICISVATAVGGQQQQPSDLWCPFCMYQEQLWQQASKRLLTAGELAFMGLITALGIDTNFTYQVVPPFWHAPVDFFDMQHGYYVQVDGRCHWVGMHGVSNLVITDRDLQQNLAAVRAGVPLVRVHERDITTRVDW